jgi:alpha-glucosidase
VVVRVSPDGVGYRYLLPRHGQVSVVGEASEFAVPAAAKAYLLPYDDGRNDYEEHPLTLDGRSRTLRLTLW